MQKVATVKNVNITLKHAINVINSVYSKNSNINVSNIANMLANAPAYSNATVVYANKVQIQAQYAHCKLYNITIFNATVCNSNNSNFVNNAQLASMFNKNVYANDDVYLNNLSLVSKALCAVNYKRVASTFLLYNKQTNSYTLLTAQQAALYLYSTDRDDFVASCMHSTATVTTHVYNYFLSNIYSVYINKQYLTCN